MQDMGRDNLMDVSCLDAPAVPRARLHALVPITPALVSVG